MDLSSIKYFFPDFKHQAQLINDNKKIQKYEKAQLKNSMKMIWITDIVREETETTKGNNECRSGEKELNYLRIWKPAGRVKSTTTLGLPTAALGLSTAALGFSVAASLEEGKRESMALGKGNGWGPKEGAEERSKVLVERDKGVMTTASMSSTWLSFLERVDFLVPPKNQAERVCFLAWDTDDEVGEEDLRMAEEDVGVDEDEDGNGEVDGEEDELEWEKMRVGNQRMSMVATMLCKASSRARDRHC